MLRYVEYDADGNIFHICTVDVAEEPAPVQETEESKTAREKRTAARIKSVEAQNRAFLQQKAAEFSSAQSGRGLIILNDADTLPDSKEHKVDVTTKKIRPLTSAEKEARRNPPVPPTP